MSENEYAAASRLAEELISSGHSADIILTDKKLGDKLSHAAKIAASGVVIGEREVAEQKAKCKNFATHTETEIALPLN